MLTTRDKGLRCSFCDRVWPPDEDVYGVCPVCREPTAPSVTSPIQPAEAQDLRVHADFGWWLWDQQRL